MRKSAQDTLGSLKLPSCKRWRPPLPVPTAEGSPKGGGEVTPNLGAGTVSAHSRAFFSAITQSAETQFPSSQGIVPIGFAIPLSQYALSGRACRGGHIDLFSVKPSMQLFVEQ